MYIILYSLFIPDLARQEVMLLSELLLLQHTVLDASLLDLPALALDLPISLDFPFALLTNWPRPIEVRAHPRPQEETQDASCKHLLVVVLPDYLRSAVDRVTVAEQVQER